MVSGRAQDANTVPGAYEGESPAMYKTVTCT